ncbi:MAG: hypothetical protein ACKV2U_21610 [Bryobacteraceae bacterium]
MKSVAKIVFATLVVAVLFLSPIDACADSMKGSGNPSHPCCPANPTSLPDDCARPGCIYLDTHVVPAAIAVNDAGPVCESPATAIWMANHPVAITARAIPLAPLPLYQRFVVFHQFLI